jgi:hypothetical protein
MSDLPIACTLTPDGMAARLGLVAALTADGLGRAPTDTGLRVRLRDTPEIERRTRELIAAESRCCAFLDFNLSRDRGDLVLDISGPEDARAVIDMFVASRDEKAARRGDHVRPLRRDQRQQSSWQLSTA